MSDNLNSGRRLRQTKKNNSEDKLGEAFEKNVRPFIEVIDSLRKHGLQNDIKLPNVVVVGDQSSGKSSIIEAISGVQLPRGRGIVTRCPLELQLKRMTNNVKWRAILSHNGYDVEIQKPQDVEGYINLAQDQICGGNKNISENLLTLRIESNSMTAPELTLIDLPGIARTAVEGQSKDICQRIKKIIEKFVKNENTVILCMISANLDVAVNESLNLAMEFDPDNERTIGVITKPDLAEDHQKEAMLRLLNNETFKLKKGYRMVKCRNHEQLERHTPLAESLLDELEFFKNDNYYRDADPSLLGTMNLANKITEELVAVIKKTIPKLQDEVKRELEKVKSELSTLPSGVPAEEGERRIYLTSVLFELVKEIERLLIKGSFFDDRSKAENVYPIWRLEFEKFQKQLIAMQEKALKNEFFSTRLQEEIKDARGREICGFLNYELFEKLVYNHVGKYKPIALKLLGDLKVITEEAVMKLIGCKLEHLPEIKKDIKAISAKAIEECAANAENNLNFIFDEEEIVFAMDSVFQAELTHTFESSNKETLNVENNAAMLGNILRCYLKIVLNRLCDTIPMTIRQWIHVKLKAILKESLMRYTSDADHREKVKENEDMRIKRDRLCKKLNRLEIAKDHLSQF